MLRAIIALMQKAGLWTPAKLFAAGEVGAWYDPSDLTTMFVDRAGSTPVLPVGTVADQPVGLILDKSKNLVLGPELVTNGDFSGGSTGWTVGAGWSISGGVAAGSAGGGGDLVSVGSGGTAGKSYCVTFTVTVYTSGLCRVLYGNTPVYNVGANGAGDVKTFSLIVTSTNADQLKIWNYGNFVGSIDNISVREIPGNHATAPNDAGRPLLSARVNQLLATQNFADAGVWGRRGAVTVTANQTIAPDGTNTADEIGNLTGDGANDIYQAVGIITGVIHTASFYIKRISTSGTVSLKFSGADILTVDLASIGDDWVRASADSVTVAESAHFQFYCSAGAPVSVYLWGAQLELGSTATPYQRVNTASDYDAVGFSRYLKFDGVDDSMSTSTINFTGTAAVTVFTGIQISSDAAVVVAVELSSTVANPGSFGLQAPGRLLVGSTYKFESGGSNPYAGTFEVLDLPVPTTNVVTAQASIPADQVTLHIDGVLKGTGTGDQGTGTYGNYPLYIGSRGISEMWFNGHLYELIVRGIASTQAEIDDAEAWVADKTGVTLL